MESMSLQSSSHIKSLCKTTKLNPPCEFRGIKQVEFPCFWRQRSHTLSFSSLKCQAFTPHANDSTPTPTDGPSALQQHQQNDEGQKGHLIGPVEDSSGSIVEFQLFSHSEHGNSNVSANLGLDKQDDEEFEEREKESFGEDKGKVREATLSKSSVNGTLGPDKQDGDQELDKEDVADENEWGPEKQDGDQELDKEDVADENEWELRETTVSEGEESSSAGIPFSVSLEQRVAKKSEVVEEISGETDDEVLGKLLTKVKFSIVFVTSEAAPYSKTGGLGDVCGSLPIALADHGHRVMVVCPRYIHGTAADKIYSGAFDVKCRIKVNCFGGAQEVAFFHEYRDGVDWVFVDHPSYHRPGNPYGDSFGAFGDNQFRFTLLCHAACEAPLVLPFGGYTYGEKCLFLVNDWHAGLVPVLLAAKYRPYGVYKDARSILVIHNLFHQGVEPAVTYNNLGLPPQWYGALEWVFPEWARAHALDKGEAVNILKGAIVTSDRILTVSQGYSWEITTVEGGYGLHELLAGRKFVLNGIINGINVSEWDPSDDPLIAAPYSVDDLSGKAECKASLQKELGLPIKPDTPLIGFIGRLDYQKGIDIIQEVFPQLMEDDVQFVMLGSGDSRYETWMRAAEGSCRDKFRGWIGFSIPISHRITAGCDILLMPSRFEPCGLNQLYAMSYGTVPVVHCTGGLRDTVETYNPFAVGSDGTGTGTGWAFSPLTKESMLSALRNAMITYRNYKESWVGLMKRGMRQDFTWDSAAAQYEQVFEWAFTDPPYC